MPAAATAATSSGMRTTLSLREYSLCRRRWMKPGGIDGDLRLGGGCCQESAVLLGLARAAAHRAEGAAMQRRGGANPQRIEVRRGAVALVHAEVKARIAGVELAHQGVA